MDTARRSLVRGIGVATAAVFAGCSVPFGLSRSRPPNELWVTNFTAEPVTAAMTITNPPGGKVIFRETVDLAPYDSGRSTDDQREWKGVYGTEDYRILVDRFDGRTATHEWAFGAKGYALGVEIHEKTIDFAQAGP